MIPAGEDEQGAEVLRFAVCLLIMKLYQSRQRNIRQLPAKYVQSFFLPRLADGFSMNSPSNLRQTVGSPDGSTLTLLGPDDPPPFTVVNPQGQAPAVLVCDHASRALPVALAQLGLGPAALAQHIAWDIGAAQVTRLLAARLDAPAVLAGYSRLVIDCNRSPGDPTSMAEMSDGIVIPGNQAIDDAAAELRLNEAFWPYHHAVTQVLAQRWRHDRGHAPALIAIHSFTPTMNGFARPWHIGVLWNRDPRLAAPLLAQLRANPELCVGDNQPYSGREVGFTMEAHGSAAGLPHLEIEIRQDLIADDDGCARWAAIVGTALETTLADEAIYQVVHY